MTVYFDFTPYVTDTPISIHIQDTCFATFLREQFDEQNIPYTNKNNQIMIGPDEYVTINNDMSISLSPNIIDMLNKHGNFDESVKDSPICKAYERNLDDIDHDTKMQL